MRKSWWLINLVLLLGAGGMVWKLRADWRADMARNGPQAVQPGRLSLPAGSLTLAPRAYASIAQQNPFSADRNDVIVSPQAAAAAVPLGPPPLYYGSIILGTQRFALLAASVGNKPPQRIPEGQTFDGYKVTEVHPQSIVFQTAAGTSEVMLYNAITRLHRSFTKTTPATTAATAASSQAASVSTASAASGHSAPAAGAAAQPAPPPPGNDTTGKHLVQTPFGPMWVKN